MSRKTTSTLQKSLKIAANEKDVENAFRAAFDNTFPSKTRSPFKVDGLLECDDVRSLLEFKYKVDLKLKAEQCGVLIQTLFYMKKFADAGQAVPTTIFVGDDSECFCMNTRALEKYLSRPIDWATAPSGAKGRHGEVLQAMVDDQDILPFVFDVNGKMFDFGDVVDQIRALGKGVVIRVKITKDNVVEIFNDWRKRVLIDEKYDHSQDLFGGKDIRAITARQSDIFFACLTDYGNETYLHPNKKNTLVSRGENIKVNADQHNAFFSRFSQILSPSELDVLVANKDRIIEEVARRRSGAFFTPTLWVAEAVKMLDESLGANWKDEYVVWDCACYDKTTRVMTDSGWKLFSELADTDLIYSYSSDTKKAEYVGFVGKTAYHYRGKLNHYSAQRMDLAVTPDHNIFILPRLRNDRKETAGRTLKSQELSDYLSRGNQARIPCAAELSGGNRVGYSDDELRFLGFYLGDGFLWKDASKTPNAVGFGIKKVRKVVFLRALLYRLNLQFTEYGQPDGGIHFRIKSSTWVTRLVDCQGAHEKRISKEFLDIPKDQCVCLLEGLWQSDGCKNGYYSMNKSLIEDVQRVCIHAGFPTYVSSRERFLQPPGSKNGGMFVCWELSCNWKGKTYKSILPDNVEEIEYDDMVYCVTLKKNHVMLVERNGHTCFCGNCGTNNLTRDFKFKELYCSTLDQGDIDNVRDMGYNPGSEIFQYDFLNDDAVDVLGPKVPAGLRKAFESGRKVLFLINPPYGTSAGGGANTAHKDKIADTKVGLRMKVDKIGSSSQQLYAQFLYRIRKLQQKHNHGGIVIGIFSKPSIVLAPSFEGLRQNFYGGFKFSKGMLFQASNFADVSGAWGISFTIWESGKWDNGKEVNVEVKDMNSYAVRILQTKTLYNINGKEATKWVRPISMCLQQEIPNLTNAINLADNKRNRKLSTEALGVFVCDSNNVWANARSVVLMSLPMANNKGCFEVIPENFRRSIALFCARKSIKGDWINDKDEYLVPHVASKDSPLNGAYEQWVNDAVVYSLFNTSSQQSSLRGVQYKGKQWDIANHFFWMSPSEMKALADKAGFQEMYQDAKQGEDSFVFKQLTSLALSDDAKAVLGAARSLIRASMDKRKAWHKDHPELHLQAFDAGWAQLKPMLKKEFKGAYDQFVSTYKCFENRMRKGVYEYGFLK